MRYGLRWFTGLVFCAYLGWASPGVADVVTDWNAIAAGAIFSPSNPPAQARVGGTGALDFAMVHLAIHDAIQAFEGRYQSYGAPIPDATGSPVAAAASAAHDVLVNRFPGQAGALDTALQNYLAALGLVGDPGVGIGSEAAAQIVSLRTGDGSWPSNPEIFTGGTGPGEWRPTLPLFIPMQAPWLGSVVPFALKDADQLFPAPPPPALTSDEYTQEYNEVKALGRAGSGSSRTQEQTDLARFYSENFFLQIERMMRGIAGPIDDLGANGRLFALTNVAAADAIITALNAKRSYNFWRPITAVQEGENDGNPDTAGDSTWLPFANTPAYPDYTSGANSLVGSITRTLALLLGDKTTFVVTSTPANQSKTYERFSDMATDVVNVRIYQGIHFRSADVVARRDGKRSADWALSHILRPLQGSGGSARR